MNILEGEIAKIKTDGSLSLVSINIQNITFKTILVENPATASYLKEGNKIKVIFKETEVALGKGLEHNISLQNKIPGSLIQIDKGQLLSSLKIKTSVGDIMAIITSNAVEKLNLKVNDEVMAMVKTNEIMLSE